MSVHVAPADRFAIFWGGGLGDLLVLRPLLRALSSRLDDPPHFFTTATHLPGLFGELGLNPQVHVLPTRPAAALRVFRDLGIRFDWLYLGPYPRIKTRMLAYVVRPRRIWSRRHPDRHPFVGEQVLADVLALGLGATPWGDQPYGGKWSRPGASTHAAIEEYVVLHPGAKARWETTRWADSHWQHLMRSLLQQTALQLLLVGMASERSHLDALRGELDPALQARVRVDTTLSLPRLADVVEASRGVICHNSGIMHLSAMLGKPTVVPTGSSAVFWRPPYPHVVNVTSGACNLACNQYRCPVPLYRARCIRELEVEKVMDAVYATILRAPG